MTRAEFDSRYKLGDRIAAGEVLSYRAHDLAAGREVTVHLFTAVSPGEVDRLRGLLRGLQGEDRGLLLAETDIEGIPVVVTDMLPGFTALPAWLEAHGSGRAPGAAGATPGEFTRVFGSLPAEPSSGGGSPPRPAPSGFTRPVPDAGTDFGQLFGPADAPRTPRPVIRLGGTPAPAPFAPPPVSSPTDYPARTDERPIFSGDVSGAAGPLWPAAPRDDLTAPTPGGAPARGPADIAELIAAGGPPRSIGSRAVEPRPSEDDDPSAPGSPPAKRGLLPLVLILTVLLLSAVGLVVYFALKVP